MSLRSIKNFKEKVRKRYGKRYREVLRGTEVWCQTGDMPGKILVVKHPILPPELIKVVFDFARSMEVGIKTDQEIFKAKTEIILTATILETAAEMDPTGDNSGVLGTLYSYLWTGCPDPDLVPKSWPLCDVDDGVKNIINKITRETYFDLMPSGFKDLVLSRTRPYKEEDWTATPTGRWVRQWKSIYGCEYASAKFNSADDLSIV